MTNPKFILKSQLTTGIEYLQEFIDLLQDSDSDIYSFRPRPASRDTGEILLHIIRSLEYYLIGVTSNTWKALPYTKDTYDTTDKLASLFDEVRPRCEKMIADLDRDELHRKYDLEQPAFGLNLMIEMLQHQSHHLGQLLTYLRLNDIEPPVYNFLI